MGSEMCIRDSLVHSIIPTVKKKNKPSCFRSGSTLLSSEKPPTPPQLHLYGKVSETNILRLGGPDGDALQPGEIDAPLRKFNKTNILRPSGRDGDALQLNDRPPP